MNSPLEYFTFKLCLTSQVYNSGTINDVKTAEGMLERNSSSTLSDF